MPGVVRDGDVSTSDPCGAPPRAPSAFSGNVFANGKGVVRLGDSWTDHSCPSSPPHGATSTASSGNVFVNGQGAVRSGDAISCGSTADVCSGNVIIN